MIRFRKGDEVNFKGRLILLPNTGECFSREAPTQWVASNGISVSAVTDGWNGSFHEAEYFPGLCHAAANGPSRKKIGPARKALQEYRDKFIVPVEPEKQKLRAFQFLRRNDD